MNNQLIIFVAHGSKKTESNVFFKELIQAENTLLTFLEFAEPSFEKSLQQNLQKEISKIHVVPLFLAPGHHVSSDLPNLIKKNQNLNPNCKIILHDFIGNHLGFQSLISDTIHQIRSKS